VNGRCSDICRTCAWRHRFGDGDAAIYAVICGLGIAFSAMLTTLVLVELHARSLDADMDLVAAALGGA